MKPLEHSLPPTSHIVDVRQFFMEITYGYQHFEASVLVLLAKVQDTSPAKIYEECKKLGVERERLARLDEQLLSILSLAGAEVVDSPMLHDYRIAFAKASMACNNLQQKLLTIRAALIQAGAIVHGESFHPSA